MSILFSDNQKANRNSVSSFQVTAISTTKKQLSASELACKVIFLNAADTNTQNLRISGDDVAANKGIQLTPGESYSQEINDVSALYVVAESAGNETLDVSYTI